MSESINGLILKQSRHYCRTFAGAEPLGPEGVLTIHLYTAQSLGPTIGGTWSPMGRVTFTPGLVLLG
jgi:hypothetical protein